MFADTAKVSLKAGKGGNGAVSFRHEIYIPKGGPDGGDGGRGGSIIFRADKDTNTLIDFRFTPILTAEDGKNGSGTRSAGRSGKDLIVEVPIGTVVYKNASVGTAGPVATTGATGREGARNEPRKQRDASLLSISEQRRFWPEGADGPTDRYPQTNTRILIADLVQDGQTAVIAKGGDGGFGNAHFKSSVRQTPKFAELGEPGEEFEAELELKLLADVGLVGLPNAGKSTFLSVVSNAKPEIADYPFTTITPNLGVATVDGKDLLIADIPGLIEGASEGKGLGHDFLRHVDRTAVLLHLVDVYTDDAGKAYKTIRTELEKYSDLASRPEVVALTKCEGLDQEIVAMQTAAILRENPDAKVYAISSSAHQGLTELLRELIREKESNVGGRTELCVPSSDNGSVSTSSAHNDGPERSRGMQNYCSSDQPLPVISLSPSAIKDSWTITQEADKFIVTGDKIEKFARRTNFDNYASVNRLRDIMKKMGIRAELTSKGANDDSIISIAGHEFTLVEDW